MSVPVSMQGRTHSLLELTSASRCPITGQSCMSISRMTSKRFPRSCADSLELLCHISISESGLEVWTDVGEGHIQMFESHWQHVLSTVTIPTTSQLDSMWALPSYTWFVTFHITSLPITHSLLPGERSTARRQSKLQGQAPPQLDPACPAWPRSEQRRQVAA